MTEYLRLTLVVTGFTIGVIALLLLNGPLCALGGALIIIGNAGDHR